ncbi:hypothetical protein GCM10028807_32820 [Spirosoma daeguense]
MNQFDRTRKALHELSRGVAEVSNLLEKTGNVMSSFLPSLSPNDLIEFCADMDESQKKRLLAYYEHRQMFEHCAVIHSLLN